MLASRSSSFLSKLFSRPMAEMIPDRLPASSTAGERRVFATLTRLPDEPVVRRRYPDLIAILPEVGVLVIEVKDWRLAELGSVSADTVTITRRGTATLVPHPRRQARGYMLRLMPDQRWRRRSRAVKSVEISLYVNQQTLYFGWATGFLLGRRAWAKGAPRLGRC